MNDSTNKDTDSDNYRRVVLAEKLINAPVEKVWAAWETGENIEQWWQTDDDFGHIVVSRYEFKPGGAWKQHLVMKNDGTDIGTINPGSTFKEIIPYERIVTVPVPIKEESVEIVPDTKETVVTFERIDDGATKVTLYVVSGDESDWELGPVAQGAYADAMESLAKYTEGR